MPAASSYDPIAEMYHTLWADWYLPAAIPALDRLFFSRVPAGSDILDVCCGSGHVTKELVRRGYRVTGVDASEGLIAIAKRDMPDVDWRVGDVRHLRLENKYSAALSTFDSLNHVLSPEELQQVFKGVGESLQPHGLFAFDMNLDEAYSTEMRQWTVDVSDTHVSLVRGSYHPSNKKACTELIWFVRNEGDELWKQYRSAVDQRSYTQTEILQALEGAGFHEIECMTAKEAGMTAELAFGRIFVTARAQV
jgi:ubiquinone/menaquinone biosynthesis C-methylase UbiE